MALYYEARPKKDDFWLKVLIAAIFFENVRAFGAGRIRLSLLAEHQLHVSEKRISKIMGELGLYSTYKTERKIPVAKKGEAEISDDTCINILNNQNDGRDIGEVLVSDVTYIKINHVWVYLCLIIDLCGRKIVGYSSGFKRDAKLVQSAIYSIEGNLSNIFMFHNDQGSEYKNKLISGILETFGILRSYSPKGCPTENSVMESTNKSIKIEFVKPNNFDSLEDFQKCFAKYVKWYNAKRWHSALGNKTPEIWRANAKPYEKIKTTA